MSGSDRSMSLQLSSTGQRALLIDAARLSRMAYASPKSVLTLYEQVKTGRFGTDFETEAVLKRVIEPPVYLDDPTSDAQGYGVKYNGPQGPMTIVAYRGTSSLADAFADSEIRLVPLKTKKLPTQKGCCVHDGFLGQFEALEQQTDDFLQGVYGGLVTGSPAVPATQSNDRAKEVGKKVHEVVKEQTDESLQERAEDVKNLTAEAVQDIANDIAKANEDVRDIVVKAIQNLANDTAKAGKDLRDTVSDVAGKVRQGDLSMNGGAGIVAGAVVDKSSGIVGEVGHVVGVGTDSDAVYESFMGGPPLVFTGHSLGSQISAIGALVYSLRYDSKGISWSGFGCPRAGNKVWASLFNSRIANGTRVKQGRDPIDAIIPPVLYRHVGKTYVHVGRSDPFQDLSLMIDIADHDIARYVANLQRGDTSDKAQDWLSYAFGFLVNTPVRIFNIIRSITVGTM